MNRTPSLWRAWSPVIYQVAGFLVLSFGVMLPVPFSVVAVICGPLIWIYGFTHGTRLADEYKKHGDRGNPS